MQLKMDSFRVLRVYKTENSGYNPTLHSPREHSRWGRVLHQIISYRIYIECQNDSMKIRHQIKSFANNAKKILTDGTRPWPAGECSILL